MTFFKIIHSDLSLRTNFAHPSTYFREHATAQPISYVTLSRNNQNLYKMDKLVDFIMSYLREVAYFFRHISDLSLWNSDSLIAVAEYIFIG